MNIGPQRHILGAGGRCRGLNDYVHALNQPIDFGGVAQIRSMPGHAGDIGGRAFEMYGVHLEIVSTRIGLGQVAADKPGGAADQDFAAGGWSRVCHGGRLFWKMQRTGSGVRRV